MAQNVQPTSGSVQTNGTKPEETKEGWISIKSFNDRCAERVVKHLCCGQGNFLKLDKDQNFFMKALRVTAVALLSLLAIPIAGIKWTFNKVCCCLNNSEKPPVDDKNTQQKEEAPAT